MCEPDKNQMRTALHEKYLGRRMPGVPPRAPGKGRPLELVGRLSLNCPEDSQGRGLIPVEGKNKH